MINLDEDEKLQSVPTVATVAMLNASSSVGYWISEGMSKASQNILQTDTNISEPF
jgi:hypothetical protein